jgi:hypothetical protein
MDIKTYVNSKKTYIDIDFGFLIIYHYKTCIKHGSHNVGEFQNSYVNIGFVFLIVCHCKV